MDISKRMLIAIDDSEASHRAVDYVAAMIGGRHGFHICLVHVLPPLPPELLEFGGSEKPEVEEREEAEIKTKQDEWLAQAQNDAQPMLAKARAILLEAHVPARGVETQFVPAVGGPSVVTDLLETAQADHCDTIVVGRNALTRLERLFKHQVADDLIRRGQGYTIWVIE